jgi:hypothetical protein
VQPKRWLLALLVALGIGGALFQSAAASAPTSLEAARKADTAAAEGVKAAEANLTVARATKAATAEAVTASEAKEPPKEEPKEPPTTAVVNASPTGPAGSWVPAFADAFAQPVGASGSFWHAKTNSKGCCGNSNETSTEVTSSVHWSEANGAELRCEALACSGVSTNNFTYALGHGASFAFETVAKLSDNTLGGEDTAFWSISTEKRWPPELDYFEYFGWGCTTACHGGFPVYKSNGLGSHECYIDPAVALGEQPWLKFHRYTTVVEGSTFTEYIDAKRICSFSQAVNTDSMGLILVHALRVSTTPRNTSFDVRSVAVYEDSAHAGQFVTNGGTAPGTTVR